VTTLDSLLAATAKVHRMTLATRNVADVAGLRADELNPFSALVPSQWIQPPTVSRSSNRKLKLPPDPSITRNR
jgi:hypothetical protein